ncbi:uncharacterized protein LOC129120141 [Agelaius phoeniceus]|uniref:uncharacterized protein LOC129120141 n=1 Tax=Agelaius phoeniceus TaxID=39638 RepID=UPI004054A0D7
MQAYWKEKHSDRKELLPSFVTSMDSMPLLFTSLKPVRTCFGSKPTANTRLQRPQLNPGTWAMAEVSTKSFLKAQRCSIPTQGQEEGRTRDHRGLAVSFGCAVKQKKQQRQRSGWDSGARPSQRPQRCQAAPARWARFRQLWSPQKRGIRQPLPQTQSETQASETRGRGPFPSLWGTAAKQPLCLPAPVSGLC